MWIVQRKMYREGLVVHHEPPHCSNRTANLHCRQCVLRWKLRHTVLVTFTKSPAEVSVTPPCVYPVWCIELLRQRICDKVIPWPCGNLVTLSFQKLSIRCEQIEGTEINVRSILIGSSHEVWNMPLAIYSVMKSQSESCDC